MMAVTQPVLAQGSAPVTLPTADSDFHTEMLGWSAKTADSSTAEDLLYPVPMGRLSSYFGLRQHPVLGRVRAHLGLDLPNILGTPVHAAASGVVTFAGWAVGYGNLVKINHGGGSETRYAHLSFIASRIGDWVHQNEIIGQVGSTGRSTGAHLHFELREQGRPVNPLTRLNTSLAYAPSWTDPPLVTDVQRFANRADVLPIAVLSVRSRVLLPHCNNTSIKAGCAAR